MARGRGRWQVAGTKGGPELAGTKGHKGGPKGGPQARAVCAKGRAQADRHLILPFWEI